MAIIKIQFTQLSNTNLFLLRETVIPFHYIPLTLEAAIWFLVINFDSISSNYFIQLATLVTLVTLATLATILVAGKNFQNVTRGYH